MQRTIALLLCAIALVGCGAPPGDESPSSPIIHARFVAADGTVLQPQTEGAQSSLPATLIITLVGPDGSHTEVVDFAERKLALGNLRQGLWSIRGDGLDTKGNLRWQAQPTTFSIKPDQETKVDLAFIEITSESN